MEFPALSPIDNVTSYTIGQRLNGIGTSNLIEISLQTTHVKCLEAVSNINAHPDFLNQYQLWTHHMLKYVNIH
jgi:hypothetical protein